MGVIRVRMDRTNWQHYFGTASHQYTDQETIRMRLDPVKMRLILEQTTQQSCLRMFLPVRSFDPSEIPGDSIYVVYAHQLQQAFETFNRKGSDTITLEFRTNTLTFLDAGKSYRVPVEYQLAEDGNVQTNRSEQIQFASVAKSSYASGQWLISSEFLQLLQTTQGSSIPFEIQDQLATIFSQTVPVYADTSFSGSFPKEPFVRFLRWMDLPATVSLQMYEDKCMRLQMLDSEVGGEAEIRFNKRTKVFFPLKKQELQGMTFAVADVKTALKIFSQILNCSYPLATPMYLQYGEYGLRLSTVYECSGMRATIPFARTPRHIQEKKGWIQSRNVIMFCEALENRMDADRLELTEQTIELTGVTVPFADMDVFDPETFADESQFRTTMEAMVQTEKWEPAKSIQLVFGKVKDFVKHIEHVPGDILRISSNAGIVDIAIDEQLVRTRKMSKRVATGDYAMKMAQVLRILQPFQESSETATIRFTGYDNRFASFNIVYRNVCYQVWLPADMATEQNIESGTMDVDGSTEQEDEGIRASTIEMEMNDWIGLSDLKQQVTKIVNYVSFERKRQSVISVKETVPSLHMCFSGNPGTGKTMTARFLGKLLQQAGVLKSGHVVEVDRQKLIGQHIGHSEANLAKYIQQAIGGILFIDEAHALYKAESAKDYGHDLIHVLVKAMEDYRSQLVVILAGYKKEMGEFLNSNIGLRDRIPFYLDFPDFTIEELLQIAKQMAKNQYSYELDANVDGVLRELIEKARVDDTFGNARMIRNLIEQAVINHANRVAADSSQEFDPYTVLTKEDFTFAESTNSSHNPVWERIQGTVGLKEVKDTLKQIGNLLVFDQKRLELGIESKPPMMHMAFTGNPGTGKTMVARLIGEWLKEIGLLKRGHFVEVSAKDLIAGYVGQTVHKTAAKIREALGGILFIDEAYALAKGGLRQYGEEAIAVLVKEMDEQRGNLVVILAGYKKEMEELLHVNPGLKSRIRFHLEFPDYQASELVEIFKQKAAQEKFEMPSEVEERLWEYFINCTAAFDGMSGNGRLAENVFEKTRLALATRIQNHGMDQMEDLLTLTVADIPSIPGAET
ncbi:AAA family ATPase [Fodinisporobacter ferrooxydans]|uniref:AAA family ATPase n=1 Tax=Fodinisporobacter ferrooxydans TaxID=2901836 RepID=A0ABY4CJ95_9BACL|nr:AAA family ATPase [Alicyclobacillaceae bacterium MYW30-H2]